MTEGEMWHIEELIQDDGYLGEDAWVPLTDGQFSDRIEAVKAFQRLVGEGRVVRLVLVTRRVVKQVHAVDKVTKGDE